MSSTRRARASSSCRPIAEDIASAQPIVSRRARSAGFSTPISSNRQLYQKRRDVMVEAFGRAGWEIPPPPASMFAWVPLPPSLTHMGSLEFAKQLLTHAEVAVAPGVGFGEQGEGFVRIAMVENEQRLRQAARNVKRYLQQMGVNSSAA